jgi:hypothetical protein
VYSTRPNPCGAVIILHYKSVLKIVTLCNYTRKTVRESSWTRRAILGFGQVSRILKPFAESGSLSPKRKGRCGRKRKTDKRMDSFVVQQNKKDPRKTSSNLQRDVQGHGPETWCEYDQACLLAVGRREKKPLKQLLTRAMIKKRLEWAKAMKNWTKED